MYNSGKPTTDLSLLNQFAEKWKLKIEGERIPGCYGFIMECNGELWCWTHSHTPDCGHSFFPIQNVYDEAAAVYLMVGPEGPKENERLHDEPMNGLR